MRGRERIAHALGVSERTVSRRVARGDLNVSYESAENNRVMVADTDTFEPLYSAHRRMLANHGIAIEGSADATPPA